MSQILVLLLVLAGLVLVLVLVGLVLVLACPVLVNITGGYRQELKATGCKSASLATGPRLLKRTEQ